MTDEVNLLLETFVRDASSNSIEAANEAVSEAVGILLYFDVYSKLVEHLLHSFAFMLRMSCKMSYVLLTIFSELVLKGFCKPQEMEEGEMEGESVRGRNGPRGRRRQRRQRCQQGDHFRRPAGGSPEGVRSSEQPVEGGARRQNVGGFRRRGKRHGEGGRR